MTQPIDELPELADLLNKTILEAQQRCFATGFKVRAEVSLGIKDRGKGETILCWQRGATNEWELHVRDEAGQVPLIRSSVEVRIAAVRKFDALLLAIADRRVAIVQELRAAIEEVESFVERLATPKDDP